MFVRILNAIGFAREYFVGNTIDVIIIMQE